MLALSVMMSGDVKLASAPEHQACAHPAQGNRGKRSMHT